MIVTGILKCVDDEGFIEIPDAVLKIAGLNYGDKLELFIDKKENQIILQKYEELVYEDSKCEIQMSNIEKIRNMEPNELATFLFYTPLCKMCYKDKKHCDMCCEAGIETWLENEAE